MCKLKIIIFLLIICAIQSSFSQQDVNSVLDYTLSYRGLTRDDITIPIDFFSAAEKSPTNDSKLMLPLVRDMMINPLRSFAWLDSVSEWGNVPLRTNMINAFDLIDSNTGKGIFSDTFLLGIRISSPDLDSFLKDLIWISKHAKEERTKLLSVLSLDEKKFLSKYLLSIVEESDNDDTTNFDIFKYNVERDSSIWVSQKVMDILSKVNIHQIKNICYNNFLDCYNEYDYNLQRFDYLKDEKLESIDNQYVKGDFVFYYDEDGIRIAIGGPGKNIYNGRFDFIIDLGGDDVYNINNENPIFSENGQGSFSCIIDLSGNDYYTTKSNFSLGGALFSSSFIFDKEGDDIYNCKSVGLGAAIGGIGMIYDESGNDTYHGLSFTIGAGCFGVGLVVDRKGNDTYIANSYSEGFGMTEGVGAIIDNTGNDSYLVDARSLDIGRYNDHYVSMCQGYGLGMRPFYAGGIGLIIEGEGNDIYNCDIFGQGGAYWYSLGAIVDKSGHDKYNGYQYAQGAGIHLAVGLLKDYDGWDFYQSDGVSQGCGHDFGFGLLYDVKGNDNYSAYSLSQGAGSADGIGMLIDESGLDGYLTKDPYNTRGYGNPRREYGSIGVFLDMSGNDYYSTAGPDSTISNTSTWGVMNDFYLTDLPSQISGNYYKVPLDTLTALKQKGESWFTLDDYFIMAKTIEPRFSLWQQYGFDRLVDDSLASSQYILTKLGSFDARESLVLINLSHKIEISVNNSLVNRLSEYLAGKGDMTQSEVSFACYIIGETRNPFGKETLLKLTYDNNVRVRSSALNALGKIKIDTTNSAFIEQVSQRLIELANENNTRKLFNKDLAYAFRNYHTANNLNALLELLSNKFYGARFLAANDLMDYWKAYPDRLSDELTANISSDRTTFQAFLNSLTDLPDGKFKSVFDYIMTLSISQDEIINLNLIDLLKLKLTETTEDVYIKYYNRMLDELKPKSVLKVK
jgi:hypothetical protein